jgi:hypothetical protein
MLRSIRDETPSASPPLSVGGIAVTDMSAIIGAVLWLAAVLTGGLDGIVEFALSLAPLVLIPLGIGMAATPPFAGTARQLYNVAVVAQPIGAVLVLVSLVVPSGSTEARLAAIPWVFVTSLLGLTALARTLDRGVWPLSETVIDAGFAYSIVGAVAVVLHQFGITFWFEPVIILLTAVHFHYAGFVLPVLTGIAGRALDEQLGTMFRLLTGIVLIGPAIIAVGISFSPVVEVLAVSVFTVAVAVLGGYVVVRVAPARPRLQGVFVAVSAVVLPASMVLALAYGLSTYTGINLLGLDISTMIELHGVLNAVGFALIGVVGWRIAVPSRHTGSSDHY